MTASKPSLLNADLMGELLKEEFNELLHSIKQRDFVEVLDALADIRYLSDGWLAQMGVNQELFDKVLEEVHQSNLSKLVDGKVVFREDGKVLKPAGYFKPNIEKILRVNNALL